MFDADHEFAEDLRRKGWFASIESSPSVATTPGFLDEYTRICEAAAPMTALPLQRPRPRVLIALLVFPTLPGD